MKTTFIIALLFIANATTAQKVYFLLNGGAMGALGKDKQREYKTAPFAGATAGLTLKRNDFSINANVASFKAVDNNFKYSLYNPKPVIYIGKPQINLTARYNRYVAGPVYIGGAGGVSILTGKEDIKPNPDGTGAGGVSHKTGTGYIVGVNAGANIKVWSKLFVNIEGGYRRLIVPNYQSFNFLYAGAGIGYKL